MGLERNGPARYGTGMRLALQRHGTDAGTATGRPPLVIVHGLFGSARNWGAIARRLGDRGPVLVPDLRNHGESGHLARHRYPDLAADLAETLAEAAPFDIAGHSMGGKTAMWLALTRPDMVRRLLVADIAPVAYGHTQIGLVQAMMAMDLTGLDGQRAEADKRLAVAVPDAGVRAFLLQSLALREGPARWRLNLPALAAEMGHVTGWPAPPAGARFEGPTLFLSGGASDYVLPEHRGAIRALFPAARFAKMPGAGHWLHAERPREVEGVFRAFFDAAAP